MRSVLLTSVFLGSCATTTSQPPTPGPCELDIDCGPDRQCAHGKCSRHPDSQGVPIGTADWTDGPCWSVAEERVIDGNSPVAMPCLSEADLIENCRAGRGHSCGTLEAFRGLAARLTHVCELDGVRITIPRLWRCAEGRRMARVAKPKVAPGVRGDHPNCGIVVMRPDEGSPAIFRFTGPSCPKLSNLSDEELEGEIDLAENLIIDYP